MTVRIAIIVFLALLAFGTPLFQERNDGRKMAARTPDSASSGPPRKHDIKMPEKKETLDRWSRRELSVRDKLQNFGSSPVVLFRDLGHNSSEALGKWRGINH
jgi:hypothetical protein